VTRPPSPLEGTGQEPAPSQPTAAPADVELPPGQHLPRGWPVLHYGRVPDFRPETWDLTVVGATADGRQHRWDWPQVAALPRVERVWDLHCVTGFSVLDRAWAGIAVPTLLSLAPPHPSVRHVLVWAEHGYSANLPLADLVQGLLAVSHGGAPLTPERGGPLRLVVPHRYAYKGPKWVRSLEYLLEDRRGFWESRGYHNRADPWQEQRWSHQEETGDGPPLPGADPQLRRGPRQR